MTRWMLAAALLALPLQDPPKPAAVRGAVKLGFEGISLKDVGPIAVYLAPATEGAPAFEVPKDRPRIVQKDAKFVPNFLVVTAGQTLDLPNEDTLVHSVFSESKPNQFDLGLYKPGESKSVTLGHAGLVNLYCSIHASMTARILVVPAPWHAVAGADGKFSIAGVPAGSYRLRTWNRMLPELSRDVVVEAGKDLDLELEFRELQKR